jgi:hypothetical protein
MIVSETEQGTTKLMNVLAESNPNGQYDETIEGDDCALQTAKTIKAN